MKKHLPNRLILALAAVSIYAPNALAETTASAPTAKDGTLWSNGVCSETNPCQITNLAELRWLSETADAWDEHFVQTADIDASETASWNGGLGFSPIGYNWVWFTGSYNGNRRTINGVFINRPDDSKIGLFGKADPPAVIHNIDLKNIDMKGSYWVGGIVGYLLGRVETTSVTGVVDASDGMVGGIIGYLYAGGSVYNGYANVDVVGEYEVGGAIGLTHLGHVENVYSVGEVIASTQPPGGLVGKAIDSTINSSYYDQNTSGQSDKGKGEPRTTDQMKQQATFENWDFDTVWQIDQGKSYPTLRPLNTAPVAEAPTPQQTDEDTPLEVTLSGSDDDGDALTYAVSTQPTSGAVSIDGNVATYTPNQDFNGQDTFEFVVNDGTADSEPALVIVEVEAVDDKPRMVMHKASLANLTTLDGISSSDSIVDFFEAENGDLYYLSYNLNNTYLVSHFDAQSNQWETLPTPTFEQEVSGSIVAINGVPYIFNVNSDSSYASLYRLEDDDSWKIQKTFYKLGQKMWATDMIISGDDQITLAASSTLKADRNDLDYRLTDIWSFNTNDNASGSVASFNNGLWTTFMQLTLTPNNNELFVRLEDSNDKDELKIYEVGSDTELLVHQESVFFDSTSLLVTNDDDLYYTYVDNGGLFVKQLVKDGEDPALLESQSTASYTPTKLISTNTGLALIYAGLDVGTQLEHYDFDRKSWSNVELGSNSVSTTNLSVSQHYLSFRTGQTYNFSSVSVAAQDWTEHEVNIDEDTQSILVPEDVDFLEVDSIVDPIAAIFTLAESQHGELQVMDVDGVTVTTEEKKVGEGDNAVTEKIITLSGVIDKVEQSAKGSAFVPAVHFTGQPKLSLQLTDSTELRSELTNITVNITPVDDELIVEDGQFTTEEDTQQQFDLSSLVTDVDGDQITFVINAIPANGKLYRSEGGRIALKVGDALTGSTLYYYPNEEYSGIDGFGFTANDTPAAPLGDRASGSANVAITVTAQNDAPVISGTPATTLKQGEVYSFTPIVTDVDVTDTHTFSIENKPSWATFDTKTGTLSGTLSSTLSGTPSNDDVVFASGIVITVTDSGEPALSDALPAFTITVESVNNAPVISGTPATSVEQDTAYSFTPNVSDRDKNDTHTFSISGKPSWATFDTKTGTLSGTPTNGDVVFASGIVISVKDSGKPVLSDALPAFTIAVENVNDAPVISGTPATSVEQDTAYSFTPNVSDIDKNDTHTFSIQNKPSWATFDTKTGTLSGTPTNGDAVFASGIVIAVTDSGKPALSDALPAFTITVENVNDAPVISGTPATSVEQDTAYSFTPNVSDIDKNDTHTFSISGKPSWADFNTKTGQLSGTPAFEHVGKYAGIVITVSDGELNDSLSAFTIEVTVAEFAINDDDLTLPSNEENVYLLDVLSNDVIPMGIEASIVSAVTDHGHVVVVNNQLQVTLNEPITDINLQYYVELSVATSEGEQALKGDAAVSVIIDRSQEDLAPVIEAPENLEVNANALFTKVDLGVATATDSSGMEIPVSLVDGITVFAPGNNKVFWKAIDEQGNEAMASQLVRVHPLVSLPKDTVVLDGDSVYQLEVFMNGEAPFYPIEIPYLVSQSEGEFSGSLVIEQGTTGVIELALEPLLDEVSNMVTVTLDSDAVNVGDKGTFVLTVQSTPVAPEVSHYVYQQGEERQVVDINGGDVTVDAVIDNAQSDDYFDYQWFVNGVEASTLNAFINDAQLVYTPILEGDEVASIDKVNVIVTSTKDSSLSTEHEVFIEVRQQLSALDPMLDTDGDLIPDSEEGYADSDNDGVPDYQDAIAECNVMQERSGVADAYLIEAEPGVCLRKGVSVANNHHGGVELDIENDGLVIDEDNTNIGGVFDFVVTGLKQPGDYASLVIPQVNAIPVDAIYTKYATDTQEWTPFIEGESDGYLSSAQGEPGYCPPPENPETSDVWALGLTEGHWCVQLTIKDGGLNDADGMANGTVVDPGGVSMALNGNTLPEANDDSYVIYVNEPQQLLVLDNDSDAEGQVSITSASATVGEVAIESDSQSLWYIPPVDQIGDVVITYGIEDSDGAKATAEASVIIINQAKPTDGEVKGSSGGSLSLGILSLLGFGAFARRQQSTRKAA